MLTKIASKVEYFLVAVWSVLLWFWLIDVPGREAHTDVLWYMNMGLNNVADPHWVIRYTHVYLQKIFLTFADQPFDGLKAYWAFIISITAALIYFNARKLTQGSTILTGIAAVAIFFSFSIHAEYAGVALGTTRHRQSLDLRALQIRRAVPVWNYFSSAIVPASRSRV